VTQTTRRTGANVYELPEFLEKLEQLCNNYRIGFPTMMRTPLVPMRRGDRQVCTLVDGPSVRWVLTHDEPSTQEPA
jgi:hypothetical protein